MPLNPIFEPTGYQCPPLPRRVLVALSGGVDSAVAALELVQAGCEVTAAYMKNWINEEEILGHCPWQQDIEDARAVSETLGIEFRVVNLMTEYRERVVQYLVEGYRQGLTPNPDVMCNREMKFGVFLDYARTEGFDAVATGHYARRLDHESEAQLFEGVDGNKDQSYFLALLRQEQLRQAFFPIGHLEKPQVRQRALEAGLPNAKKKDSQGICFIGEVRINDFLEHYIPDAPGPIVNTAGKPLGEHRGLHRYTLGQRKGLGVPSNTDNEHYVVVAKEAQGNRLVVAFESTRPEALFRREHHLHKLSWIGQPVRDECDLLARPRYRDPAMPVRFQPDGQGGARLLFAESPRALAPGQVCAIYDGRRLLGGGVYV